MIPLQATMPNEVGHRQSGGAVTRPYVVVPRRSAHHVERQFHDKRIYS